jgi:hypothetical protein
MSVNTSSRLGLPIDPRREQSEEERARNEHAEQWAHLLAHSVVQQIPVNWAGEASSPNTWRTSDSALTPAAARRAGAVKPAARVAMARVWR